MHDNTQSLAYGRSGRVVRDYLKLIETYQADNTPFLGYLHTNGYLVTRTDKHKLEPKFKITYDKQIDSRRWSRDYTEIVTETRLRALQYRPFVDGDRIEITNVKPLKAEWAQLSKPTAAGIRKAAEKIRKARYPYRPHLLETVESDGDTTTYMQFG